MYDNHNDDRNYYAQTPATRMPHTQYRQHIPQMPSAPRPPQRRRMGVGGISLLILACMLFAAAAGFAGGYIAIMRRPLSIAATADPVISQPGTAPSVNFITPSHDNNASSAQDVFSSSSLISETGGESMSASEVAAAVRESVVEIKTETVTTGIWTGTYISEGAGSGVIVSEDGYIITNDHVIDSASNIVVRLVDGREYPASLIATDKMADIAVIQISVTGLKPAVFGDSSALVVGEGTLAVGNPLGELGGTVTGGMISALDREITVDGTEMTLLQTDAAINPGNSGGGLFNMRAELIGIVNAKSGGTNIEGLGFAIPSNVAKVVASDLVIYGFVRGRTETGLELVDIQNAQTARWYRVSQTGLYIISSVNEQLRNGDRITAVNGKTIITLSDFNRVMKSYIIGEKVTITVVRGNETISADITLMEWRP